jgi:hypothetical protein
MVMISLDWISTVRGLDGTHRGMSKKESWTGELLDQDQTSSPSTRITSRL